MYKSTWMYSNFILGCSDSYKLQIIWTYQFKSKNYSLSQNTKLKVMSAKVKNIQLTDTNLKIDMNDLELHFGHLLWLIWRASGIIYITWQAE